MDAPDAPVVHSSSDAPLASSRQAATENRVVEISSLLRALEEAATESGLSARRPSETPQVDTQHENRLVQVRLGIASSLFTALRHKHPQSADHSLRVALGCSSWALFAQLDEETHSTVELAALMHDVGKIGVPDGILLKPNRLTSEEQTTVSRHRKMGLEILANCCSSDRVLNAVRYAGARYDGLNSDQDSDLTAKGEQIPLEARMIAIVDAFDAMTTDQVYRPARSREWAMKELFEHAGAQFDPVLVKQFVQVFSQHQDLLSEQVATRWLRDLSTQSIQLPWQLQPITPRSSESPSNPLRSLFEQKLIDSMTDGVVFVDTQARICLWNKGAERLTGVSSEAALGRTFTPSLLAMRHHHNHRISDEACPVARTLRTTAQMRQRLQIMGRNGKHVAVDLHAIPVQSPEGELQGAVALLHDAQPEASLEKKCEALHAEATKDPMTKVANRAEFDRMQALFIEAHLQAGLPCSLIMADIDLFKRINDTYGHQAGDEAIIAVANLLSSMCRSGDLVARYGGEEFVVLCADCSNADAARRAEQIRRKIAETFHGCLGNKRVTVSFGVTELQAGDTPETMLRRADRALLMAKEQGRNQVVQLGNGMENKRASKSRKWWKFGGFRAQPVVQTTLTTAVPIDIAIEKLRGFVSDHQAKIVSTCENSVKLEISSERIIHFRRKEDRHIIFRIELQFSEERVERSGNLGFVAAEHAQTYIQLKIRPKRTRNRRNGDMAERARLILQSIKAYMMAEQEEDKEQAVFSPTI